MKTLRDLAEHMREAADEFVPTPNPALIKAWATEIDQCLDLIASKAQDVIDETTSGYVTTKHEEEREAPSDPRVITEPLHE